MAAAGDNFVAFWVAVDYEDEDDALGGRGGGRSFLDFDGVEAYPRKGDGRNRRRRPEIEIVQRPIMVENCFWECNRLF